MGTRRLYERSAGAITTAAALIAAVMALLPACGREVGMPLPPPTRVEEVIDTYHGVEVADPYRWLEDGQSAETRRWVEAQNAYTGAILGDLPGRQKLKQRFEELLRVETVTVPLARVGSYYFSRRRPEQDLFVIYRRDDVGGEDRVLLDPHPLSEDRSISLELLDVTEDGRLLAYGVRRGGRDELGVRVFDVEAGRDLPDQLPEARYFGVHLAPDGSALYYARHRESGPRLLRHRLGGDPAEDEELFGTGYGPEKILLPSLSTDGRFLLATVLHGSAPEKTEIYLKDLRQEGDFVAVVDDLKARFFAEFGGDTLYLRTNWQAPNQRILAVDLGNPARERWREVVPEREGAVIESFEAAGGRLLVHYLESVSSRLALFEADGRAAGEIAFDAPGTVDDLTGRWQDDEIFFSFTSFHLPETVYRYRVSTGTREEWFEPPVLLDAEGLVTKQVWFRSQDGTRVPMFLVHGSGLERDGGNPTLLTGYGGFTVSRTPRFSAGAAVWAESGGVWAVANLRGGGEFGEEWHRAGMLDNKQNVFDDFIAAAEWLIAESYTRSDRLAISGGSNGGLLVAAAMNQRPDLFGAVICSYPLLDMLRYQNFLVARYWVPEYGSSEDPEQFEYLYAYSPYHNVEPEADYPAVLFITGDGDTRVDPLHARKMAALMQAAAADARPVLLRYHTKLGHSAGGQPVSEEVENLSDSFAFLRWQLGLE